MGDSNVERVDRDEEIANEQVSTSGQVHEQNIGTATRRWVSATPPRYGEDTKNGVGEGGTEGNKERTEEKEEREETACEERGQEEWKEGKKDV